MSIFQKIKGWFSSEPDASEDVTYRVLLNDELQWDQEHSAWYVVSSELKAGDDIVLWSGRGGAFLEQAIVKGELITDVWTLEFPEPAQ
jgi:hypothetical protein